MHMQSDGTQVAVRPAPRPVVGTPGWVSYVDPETGLGTPSNDDPDLMNAIVDELCGMVTGLGGTLSKTNNAQIIALLKAYFVPLSGMVAAYGNNGYLVLPKAPGMAGNLILQWGSDSIQGNGQTAVAQDKVYPTAFPAACWAVVGSGYTPSYTYSGNDGVFPAFSSTLIQTNKFRAVLDNLNSQPPGTPPVINRVVGYTFLALGT